jgi:hypothetical protein
MPLPLLAIGVIAAVTAAAWGIVTAGVWALIVLLFTVAIGSVVMTAVVLGTAARVEHPAPESVATREDRADADIEHGFDMGA